MSSLLKNLDNTRAVAIDLSPDAVALTKCNAMEFIEDRRLNLLNCSLESFIQMNQYKFHFDFIVSNPPYIETAAVSCLEREVFDYESHLALDGGIDGLDVIKQLISSSPMLLKKCSYQELYLEMGYKQRPLVESFISGLSLARAMEFWNDFQGISRFAKIVY